MFGGGLDVGPAGMHRIMQCMWWWWGIHHCATTAGLVWTLPPTWHIAHGTHARTPCSHTIASPAEPQVVTPPTPKASQS